jgi:sugar phosphate isomerase/epimerase
MQLGFVSAILGELTLEEVFAFASQEGFKCVELMAWPVGKADRRYAGVTHIDAAQQDQTYYDNVLSLTRKYGVNISALGYYPNPLDPDPEVRTRVVEHLKHVLRAAARLGVKIVNTFIGRDPAQTIRANMHVLRFVWDPVVELATSLGVKIGIEHCPMLFSDDEWPGGKNLAISPVVWRELLAMYPDGTLGLNFDPSHLIWQQIDIRRALKEFGKHLVHVHAKDEKIDHDRLYEGGVMSHGWHRPKLPGLGDVPWGDFFSALTDTGYRGPVCVEVEDRAYEASLEDRFRSIRQSRHFLQQYFG